MLTVIAAVLYILVSASHWTQKRLPWQPWSDHLLLGIAIATHALGLQRIIVQQQGIDLGLFKALSLLGLIIGLLALFSQIRRQGPDLLVWLLPLSAASALGGALLSTGYEARTFSFGLILHIMFALLAYALFTVSVVYAFIVRAQDRALKHHKLSSLLMRLPPLQTMERAQFRLLWISFVLLSLAMLIGFVSTDSFMGQQLVHKTAFTLLAWVFFCILFAGHHLAGWRAVMTIRWLVPGYLLLTLGFFGSKVVLEFFLAG